MAEGQSVGRISIRVLPDTRAFARELRAQVDRACRNADAIINVRPDADRLRQELQAATARASRGLRVDVPVRVDTSGLEALSSERPGKALGALARSLSQIGAMGGAVQVVGGLATSLSQMAGAALLAPAALGAAGAAFATVKIGLSGFSDAVKNGGEDLAKLAPNARATAEALRGMKPAWDQVKATVQDRLFAGVAGDMRDLGGKYLPVLKTGLGGVAEGWNQVAKNALGALKAPESVGAVKSVLDATGSSLLHMQESLGHLISGFAALAGAGAKFIAGTGGGFTRLTENFEAWSQRITTDGSFERWVTAAGEAFRQLFDVIRNVGTIVTTVISGLSSSSVGLFASLQAATGQIAAFLKSAEGQSALQALGQTLQTVSSVLRDVLGAALAQIGPLAVALAPVISEVARSIGTALTGAINVAGPLLRGIADLFASIPGSATAVVGALAGLWAAFQVGGAIVSVVKAATIAWQGAQMLARGATVLWTGVQWLLNSALAANPIGIVVVAIGALVAAVVLAWQNSETFRNIVLAVWEAVKTAIGAAVDFIKGVIGWFANLPGMIAGWFGAAKDWAVAKLGELVSWVSGLPGRIVSALGDLAGLLVNAGISIVTGLLNGLKRAFETVKNWVSGVADWIAAHKGPLPRDRRLLIPAGRSIMKGLHDGLTREYGKVQSFVSGVADDIAGSFGAPIDVQVNTNADELARRFDGGTWNAEMRSAITADGYADLDRRIVSALSGMSWAVQLDNNGLAKIVNKTNTRMSRRGK